MSVLSKPTLRSENKVARTAYSEKLILPDSSRGIAYGVIHPCSHQRRDFVPWHQGESAAPLVLWLECSCDTLRRVCGLLGSATITHKPIHLCRVAQGAATNCWQPRQGALCKDARRRRRRAATSPGAMVGALKIRALHHCISHTQEYLPLQTRTTTTNINNNRQGDQAPAVNTATRTGEGARELRPPPMVNKLHLDSPQIPTFTVACIRSKTAAHMRGWVSPRYESTGGTSLTKCRGTRPPRRLYPVHGGPT